jgi:hypothetical protein
MVKKYNEKKKSMKKKYGGNKPKGVTKKKRGGQCPCWGKKGKSNRKGGFLGFGGQRRRDNKGTHPRDKYEKQITKRARATSIRIPWLIVIYMPVVFHHHFL